MSRPKLEGFCCWCTYLRTQPEYNLPAKPAEAMGRCNTCYKYRKRTGYDRSLETIEDEIERELGR